MSLGSMITQARKSAGLSIEDLSASTNIRGSLLREMESDSFGNCGGETYARGHIRNIATKLGVDPLIFIAAFEEEKMLGCCFLTAIDSHGVKLRQLAVQNNLQGKGIGASLMNFAENIARDRGFRTIQLNARKVALEFFEKQGYKVEGDEFIQLGIPHYLMKKKLR